MGKNEEGEYDEKTYYAHVTVLLLKTKELSL
jgi:hypothetical protein